MSAAVFMAFLAALAKVRVDLVGGKPQSAWFRYEKNMKFR